MCMIIFAYDCHPHYQLIVAANRDEFYKRPDLPAAFWPDQPEILAGRDLHQGGTWMGITKMGRFAALTNYRDPANMKAEAPSRGKLVQNYLIGAGIPEAYYIDSLKDQGAQYNGFNLLFGNIGSLYYYSNRENVFRKVEQGIHGLSNSLLDTPWPKVNKSKQSMKVCLDSNEVKPEQLFALMADREQPGDLELPQTGVSLEMERMLSPSFVVSENYGTKSTTILLVDRNNNVEFRERRFTNGKMDSAVEVYFSFPLLT